MKEERTVADEYFMQANWSAPVCNHVSAGISGYFKGYAQGVTFDGIPFEVERWMYNGSEQITFVLPRIDYLEERNIEEQKKQKEKELDKFLDCSEKESTYVTVMEQGMVIPNEVMQDQVLCNYVDYLVDTGLIYFDTWVQNGFAQYLIDREGKTVVGIIVCLNDNGSSMAETSLQFNLFPDQCQMPKT